MITLAVVAVLRTAGGDVFRRLVDAVEPVAVDKAEAALAALPGVQSVRRLRMRWIGYELHADVDLVIDSSDGAEAHCMAHNAEHEPTHAMPRLRTAVVHAYPPEFTGYGH